MIKIKLLSPLEATSFEDIKYRFQSNIPIIAYLSGLINKSEVDKSDWLLNNFNIYHCHLEQKLANGHFNRKSNNLLFFTKKNDSVYFIDIKKHPKGDAWLDIDLLKIIEENNWIHLLN